MALTKTSPFQSALDVVEKLPELQREHLIQVLQHRFVEDRRNDLATNIHEAKSDHKQGKVKRGSVRDLMKELRSCAD